MFHDQIFLGNLGLDGGAGAGETARMDVFRNPPGTPANEERVLLSLLAREHEDVYVDVLVRLQRLSAVRGPGFGGIANDPVLKELRQVRLLILFLPVFIRCFFANVRLFRRCWVDCPASKR